MTGISANSMDDDFNVSQQELLAGELTAAMLTEQLGDDDALPPALATRLTATGEALVRARTVPPITSSRMPLTEPRRARSAVMWTGWLAAAAVLALWVSGRNTNGRDGESRMTTPAVAIDARVALRDSLLATPALVRRAWSATGDRAAMGAEGEVLWDPVSQRGLMRFTRLASNDPGAWQYQLWIFDEQRDERYPVDGGVFDIPPGETDVLVPIRARLAVNEAVLFAVTVERPGGVVVSNRERIAVLAKI